MIRYNTFAALAVLASAAAPSQAALITFSSEHFKTTPVFNQVATFAFTLDFAGTLTPGASFSAADLSSVVYSVSGTLPQGSPSGFPGFALERIISGDDFIAQGSAVFFSVSGAADLSDGLQVSELGGNGNFDFSGREQGTGRYHPAQLQLFTDGTGSLRNADNLGGINPGSGNEVDVLFGEEYITDLSFEADKTTISAVPVPPALAMFASALALLDLRRRWQARSGCGRG